MYNILAKRIVSFNINFKTLYGADIAEKLVERRERVLINGWKTILLKRYRTELVKE